jgi:hypothetical protein
LAKTSKKKNGSISVTAVAAHLDDRFKSAKLEVGPKLAKQIAKATRDITLKHLHAAHSSRKAKATI